MHPSRPQPTAKGAFCSGGALLCFFKPLLLSLCSTSEFIRDEWLSNCKQPRHLQPVKTCILKVVVELSDSERSGLVRFKSLDRMLMEHHSALLLPRLGRPSELKIVMSVNTMAWHLSPRTLGLP